MTASSPDTKLAKIKYGDVVWTSGFWADKFDLCRKSIVRSVREALDNPTNAAVFSNFYVAAGLIEGEHLGVDWGDGDCYKWIEAMTHIYAVTREENILTELDELIDVIAAAQEPDGYICTQIQLDAEKERWSRRKHHELYNMGHLLTAASIHHLVTGKENFLNIAVKLGDYLYSVFLPRPPELAHYGWNPSNIMGLVDLYRATGEQRYLDLAEIFVDMRGSGSDPDLVNIQDHYHREDRGD